MIKYVVPILFLLIGGEIFSQISVDCSIAIPICDNTPLNGGTNGYGIDDFNGSSVSGCITQGFGTIETNSAWYRFKTGESGQLGFNIGFAANEDWDFALYKTNDCTSLGEPVRCNYFDNTEGSTFIGVGVDPTGAENIQYDDWLDVAPGEEYYLFINNFSNTNSGFSIQFSGNIFITYPDTALDCSINDNLLGPPIIACEGDTTTLDATTVGALGYEWYSDMGSGYQKLTGENGPMLSVATSALYKVIVLQPSGANISSETQVGYAPLPVTQPLTDMNVCLDGTAIDLKQKDSQALGTQSAVDFRVTYHNSLTEAMQDSNPMSSEFIATEPSKTIFVRTSSLQNNNCFDIGESFEIIGITPPVLDFETEMYICVDTPSADIGQNIANPNYSYQWDSGQDTSFITVSEEGVYTLTATTTNGSKQCTLTRSVTVVFSTPPIISTIDIKYQGNSSNQVEVVLSNEGVFEYQLDDASPQTTRFFTNVSPGEHLLTVTDLNGCGFVTEEFVMVGFPPFFTPNGDGVNDTWRMEGISFLENPIVSIYDRYGKFLYQIRETSSSWDGSFNGRFLPESDYWFRLTYTNTQGQDKIAPFLKNHFTLKR